MEAKWDNHIPSSWAIRNYLVNNPKYTRNYGSEAEC